MTDPLRALVEWAAVGMAPGGLRFRRLAAAWRVYQQGLGRLPFTVERFVIHKRAAVTCLDCGRVFEAFSPAHVAHDRAGHRRFKGRFLEPWERLDPGPPFPAGPAGPILTPGP